MEDSFFGFDTSVPVSRTGKLWGTNKFKSAKYIDCIKLCLTK